jgi:hypothetical protein
MTMRSAKKKAAPEGPAKRVQKSGKSSAADHVEKPAVPSPSPKKTTKKRPVGRPPTRIDAKVVEAMAYAGGSTEEIADFCSVSRDTIERRFMPLLIKSRARRKLRLRQLQWQAAESGDKTMLIWLGKVELGQAETVKNEHTGKDGQPLPPTAIQVTLVRPKGE